MDDRTRPSAELPRGTLTAVGAAGLALTTAVIALTLAESPSHDRAVAATVYGLLVAVPVGVALTAIARHPRDRFAWLLVGAAALWSPVALSASSDATLYSLGRVALWLVEPVLIYLLLAFPSGRLTTTVERRVAGAAALLAGLLYLPTALLVGQFPQPSPGTACGASCPDNALALPGVDVAFVGDVVRPLREMLLVLLYIAVAAVLARRARHAGQLLRRALVPVIATAALRVVVAASYLLVRRADPGAASLDALGWIYIAALPLVAVGFGAGALLRRLHAATALERLAQRLRGHASVNELRGALADALEDPTLRIVHWRAGEPGQWLDETGWPAAPPEATAEWAVTEVAADGRRVAAIVHDAALAHDPALMQAAASYALAVLENDRLIGRLRGALDDLSRSRSRMVTVGDDVRRRIERDLHDGAQQRLVALRIELALESERLQADDHETARLLAQLGQEVEETIDEVRALARGIYPSVLSEHGLAAALRTAVVASPIPATLDLDGIGRLSPEVETTVYFACVEALQNVAKHAHGARRVDIAFTNGARLHFAISDDGEGFDESAVAAGHGLANLRDRLAAVGGEITIRSSPGHGTRVAGSVPVATGAG